MSKPETPAKTRATRAPRTAPRLNDPRSRRSREALRNALLRLIENQLFDTITLREITLEAELSYPTFFNHYDSKEDLFLDLARGEILALLTAFQDRRDLPDWRPGLGMCVHILRHRSLWRTLLTAGASEAMRTEFIRRGHDLAGHRPFLSHGYPIDVISGVIASGTFEIIAWWLSQDPASPAEPIANMLETLVVEPALGLAPGTFTARKGLMTEADARAL